MSDGAVGGFVLIGFVCAFDLAYRFGLSRASDLVEHQLKELRDGIFIDLSGIGVSLGFFVGVFVIRVAGIEDELWRIVVGIFSGLLGWFALALSERIILRFFGVDLEGLVLCESGSHEWSGCPSMCQRCGKRRVS